MSHDGGGDILGTIGGLLATVWNWLMLIILGIITLPAMLIMASLYRTWESWLKDYSNMSENILKAIFLLPLTILIAYAMMILAIFHKAFDARVASIFGRKIF